MAESSKPVIELQIPLEVADNTDNNGNASAHPNMGSEQEVPTITSLLQRKKIPVGTSTMSNSPVSDPAPVSMPPTPKNDSTQLIASQTSEQNTGQTSVVTSRRRRGLQVIPGGSSTGTQTNPSTNSGSSKSTTPPPFMAPVVVEALDLKSFDKKLSKHKKLPNLKKLDCLGYFSTRFKEITYFENPNPQSDDVVNLLKGVLGFGSTGLVLNAKNQKIEMQFIPGVFEILGAKESFVGNVENLKAKDKAALMTLGFMQTSFVGIFTVVYKKKIQGVWIATSSKPVEMDAKELKKLKKILNDLFF